MGIAAGEDVIFFRVGGISAADEKLFRVGDLNGVEAEMIRDFAQSGKDAHAVAVDVGRVAKAAVPGSQGRGVIDGEEGGIGEELFQAAEFVILGIHEELGAEDLFPVGDGGQGGVDLLAGGFGRFRSGKKADHMQLLGAGEFDTGDNQQAGGQCSGSLLHGLDIAGGIVGADGGGSLVRRSLYGTHEIARYVAVQEWYADDSGSPFYGALFDEELTDCYGWLISKNDRLVLGAAFPQDNAARRFACLKRRLQKRGFVFGERVRREGCIVCRPTGPKSFCTGRDGAFLVGEAAGFISPSSLEGISYALDSGALLAKALLPGIAGAGRRYAQLTAGLRLRLLGKLMKNPFLYQPVIRETILESGLASLSVLSAAGRTASRPEAAAPDTGAAPGCTAQRR